MPQPIIFPEQTHVFNTEADEVGGLHVIPLPVRVTRGSIISKWRFSEEELATLAETGELYLEVVSAIMPILRMEVTDPALDSEFV